MLQNNKYIYMHPRISSITLKIWKFFMYRQMTFNRIAFAWRSLYSFGRLFGNKSEHCVYNFWRYENLPKGGSYNRKIDEVILDAFDILEGNPLMTLQQVNFALKARLPQKPHFAQQALSKALEGRMITFKIARDCLQSVQRRTYRKSFQLWIVDHETWRHKFASKFCGWIWCRYPHAAYSRAVCKGWQSL